MVEAEPATARALCGTLGVDGVEGEEGGEGLNLRRIPHVRLNAPKHVVFAIHGVGVHGHSTMRRKVGGLSLTRCMRVPVTLGTGPPPFLAYLISGSL